MAEGTPGVAYDRRLGLKLVQQAHDLKVKLELYAATDLSGDQRAADMEFVDARNQTRELQRTLDEIKTYLGGNF